MRLTPFCSLALSMALAVPGVPQEGVGGDERIERLHEALLRNPRPGTTFDRWFREVVEAGRLDTVAREVEATAEASPGDVGRQLIHALLAHRLGDRSSWPLEQALRADAEHPMVRRLRAEHFEREREWDLAVEEYRQALSFVRNADDESALLRRLGSLYLRLDRRDEATRTWKRLIDRDPRDRHLRTELAELLAGEGELESAIEHFEVARELADDDAYARFSAVLEIASLRERLGDSTAARRDYADLLSILEPDSWQAREVRTRIAEDFWSRRDADGLIEFWDDRVRVQPDDLPARLALVDALLRANRQAAALEQLELAVELAPEDDELRRRLLDSLMRAGDFDRATRQCALWAALRPGAPEPILQQGELALRRASPDEQRDAEAEAVALWRRAAALRPDDGLLAIVVAERCRAAELRRRSSGAWRAPRDASVFLDCAEELHREAVARRPDLLAAHESLGSFLWSRGRRDDAVSAWRAMAAAPRDLAENLTRLAEVLRRHERTDDALATLARAVEKAPEDTQLRETLVVRRLEARRDGPLGEGLRRHLRTLEQQRGLAGLARCVELWVQAETRAGSLAEAIAELDAIAEPTARDRWLRGRLLLAANRGAEGVSALREAVHQQPDHEPLARSLAEAYELTDDHARAARQHRRNALRFPQTARRSLRRVALLELAQGRLDDAADAAEELLRLDPSDVESHLLRARIAFDRGEPAVGVAALRRAVRAAPRDLEVRLELASRLQQRRELAEAFEHLWRAFELSDELSRQRSIARSLGVIAAGTGRLELLSERLHARARLGDVKVAGLCLVDALDASGQPGLARRELDQLRASLPTDADVLRAVVSSALEDDDPAVAIEALERLAAMEPAAAYLEQLARLYSHSSRREDARETWVHLARESGDADAVSAEIEQLVGRGELREGRDLAVAALRVVPADWKLTYWAGLLASQTGDTAASDAWFAELLRIPSTAKGPSITVFGAAGGGPDLGLLPSGAPLALPIDGARLLPTFLVPGPDPTPGVLARSAGFKTGRRTRASPPRPATSSLSSAAELIFFETANTEPTIRARLEALVHMGDEPPGRFDGVTGWPLIEPFAEVLMAGSLVPTLQLLSDPAKAPAMVDAQRRPAQPRVDDDELSCRLCAVLIPALRARKEGRLDAWIGHQREELDGNLNALGLTAVALFVLERTDAALEFAAATEELDASTSIHEFMVLLDHDRRARAALDVDFVRARDAAARMMDEMPSLRCHLALVLTQLWTELGAHPEVSRLLNLEVLPELAVPGLLRFASDVAACEDRRLTERYFERLVALSAEQRGDPALQTAVDRALVEHGAVNHFSTALERWLASLRAQLDADPPALASMVQRLCPDDEYRWTVHDFPHAVGHLDIVHVEMLRQLTRRAEDHGLATELVEVLALEAASADDIARLPLQCAVQSVKWWTGSPDSTLPEIRALQRRHPDDVELRLWCARAHLAEGELRAALDLLRFEPPTARDQRQQFEALHDEASTWARMGSVEHVLQGLESALDHGQPLEAWLPTTYLDLPTVAAEASSSERLRGLLHDSLRRGTALPLARRHAVHPLPAVLAHARERGRMGPLVERLRQRCAAGPRTRDDWGLLALAEFEADEPERAWDAMSQLREARFDGPFVRLSTEWTLIAALRHAVTHERARALLREVWCEVGRDGNEVGADRFGVLMIESLAPDAGSPEVEDAWRLLREATELADLTPELRATRHIDAATRLLDSLPEAHLTASLPVALEEIARDLRLVERPTLLRETLPGLVHGRLAALNAAQRERVGAAALDFLFRDTNHPQTQPIDLPDLPLRYYPVVSLAVNAARAGGQLDGLRPRWDEDPRRDEPEWRVLRLAAALAANDAETSRRLDEALHVAGVRPPSFHPALGQDALELHSWSTDELEATLREESDPRRRASIAMVLARLFLQANKFERAEEHIVLALEQDPAATLAEFAWPMLIAEQGPAPPLEGARLMLRRLPPRQEGPRTGNAGRPPDDEAADALALRGLARLRLGQYEKARECLVRARFVRPGRPSARDLYLLSAVDAELGNRGAAHQTAEMADDLQLLSDEPAALLRELERLAWRALGEKR